VITDIYISYPWWTIILVIATGLIYAGLLYIRNPLNKLNTTISVILFIFRFVVVSFLAFLLLSPYIKTKTKQLEKPIIVIGQDNSSSILMTKDSAFYRTEFSESIKLLSDYLSVKNDVDNYKFGDYVRESDSLSYKDNASNYSDFFSHFKQNYSGLNVGAIVLIGDGIINNGIDPVYAAVNIDIPVFTVALGDSSQMRDLKIDDIRYNSMVYSGDIFPIEINVNANMHDGDDVVVKLLENNRLVGNEYFKVVGNSFSKNVKFSIPASGSGTRRFSVIIEGALEEQITENNSRDVFINVIDSRNRILILANAPHPDVGAIKQSLLHNQNFEVEIGYISSTINNLNSYDLIILYQVPSRIAAARQILREIKESEKPVLYILGRQSGLSEFSRYFEGLDIKSTVGAFANARFEPTASFPLFTFDRELLARLSTFPPLQAPLGNYQLSSSTQVFGWQNISDITTNFPLIAFYNNIGVKSAVITGEGLWQWRMQDNIQHNNTNAIDALLNKSMMYLLADTDKRRFKVLTKSEFNNNDDVVLTAELYNQALEPSNTADVSLVMTNENNETFNFLFSPFDNYYVLNLSKLPVGIYKYKATSKLGNDNFSDVGEFVVRRSNIESIFLNADHRMLNRLAVDHNGSMYYPNQIEDLKNTLDNLDSLKTRVHYQDRYMGINSIFFIFAGLVFLLSLEWFLRKYFGSY
jgi:hypothetical protein